MLDQRPTDFIIIALIMVIFNEKKIQLERLELWMVYLLENQQ